MTYAELQARAREYLGTFPDQTPEQIYINGFLAGFRVAQEECTEDPKLVIRIDYAGIKALWKDHCPAFSELRAVSEKRKEKIRARWKEFSNVGDPVDVCVGLFDKMQASAFLRGESKRGWKASFDWLFENSNNWVKVYEGQYDDRPEETADDKSVNNYWDR